MHFIFGLHRQSVWFSQEEEEEEEEEEKYVKITVSLKKNDE